MQPFEAAVYVAPLPRNWEKALGYTTETPRRWLLAYWSPWGDEATFEDGTLTATSNWQPYLDVVQQGPLSITLRHIVRQQFEVMWVGELLGNSERQGTHGLLADLVDRELYLAEREAARVLMAPPPLEGYLSPPPTSPIDRWDLVQAHLADERQRTLADHQGKRMDLCLHCVGGGGYILAEDRGYDRCPVCHGNYVRWIPIAEGETPTIEIWEDGDIPLPWDPDPAT